MGNRLPKISIIVPVYNSEKYLSTCVDSLVSQTLKEIEIIFVNDGSTDNSSEIIRLYCDKHTNIKIIEINNSGSSLARKTGVQNAIGEYVCFVDSDDYVEPEFCEALYKLASLNNAQLVECNYFKFSDNFENIKKLYPDYDEEFTFSREEFLDKVVKMTIINSEVGVVMWNKIYQTEIVKKYVLDYGNDVLEDYLFNMQYYEQVHKYVFTSKPLYHYRISENSFSRRFNSNAFSVLLKVQEKKQIFMHSIGLNDEKCLQLSYIWFINYVESILRTLFFLKQILHWQRKVRLQKIF